MSVRKSFNKLIAKGILCAFLANMLSPLPVARAEEILLPKPGQMVSLSPSFSPVVLKGIKLDPKNPFKFDFFVDQGDLQTRGHVQNRTIKNVSPPPEADQPLAESDQAMSARGGSASGGNAKAPQGSSEGQANNNVELKQESTKLIKYFLASLTIPEQDLWVNLSPYEKNRIVPKEFGQTEMGRDLLAQDYLLKQITASLIYPESKLGKEFWQKVYAQAQVRFGTTNIPINTFNKVWIVPEKAVVYENGGTAFVLENHLKVMLEKDYLALNKNSPPLVGGARGGGNDINTPLLNPPHKGEEINSIASQIVRDIVIPALTREVNEGKNFAPLRQVFYSLILATWYKKKMSAEGGSAFSGKDSILNKVYSDKKKIKGTEYTKSITPTPTRRHVQNRTTKNVSSGTLPTQQPMKSESTPGEPPSDVDTIYQQYLKAFKKGVFNYIATEDGSTFSANEDRVISSVSRKYFSGGVIGIYLDSAMSVEKDPAIAMQRLNGGKGLVRVGGDFNFIKTGDSVQLLSQQLVDAALITIGKKKINISAPMVADGEKDAIGKEFRNRKDKKYKISKELRDLWEGKTVPIWGKSMTPKIYTELFKYRKHLCDIMKIGYGYFPQGDDNNPNNKANDIYINAILNLVKTNYPEIWNRGSPNIEKYVTRRDRPYQELGGLDLTNKRKGDKNSEDKEVAEIAFRVVLASTMAWVETDIYRTTLGMGTAHRNPFFDPFNDLFNIALKFKKDKYLNCFKASFNLTRMSNRPNVGLRELLIEENILTSEEAKKFTLAVLPDDDMKDNVQRIGAHFDIKFGVFVNYLITSDLKGLIKEFDHAMSSSGGIDLKTEDSAQLSGENSDRHQLSASNQRSFLIEVGFKNHIDQITLETPAQTIVDLINSILVSIDTSPSGLSENEILEGIRYFFQIWSQKRFVDKYGNLAFWFVNEAFKTEDAQCFIKRSNYLAKLAGEENLPDAWKMSMYVVNFISSHMRPNKHGIEIDPLTKESSLVDFEVLLPHLLLLIEHYINALEINEKGDDSLFLLIAMGLDPRFYPEYNVRERVRNSKPFRKLLIDRLFELNQQHRGEIVALYGRILDLSQENGWAKLGFDDPWNILSKVEFSLLTVPLNNMPTEREGLFLGNMRLGSHDLKSRRLFLNTDLDRQKSFIGILRQEQEALQQGIPVDFERIRLKTGDSVQLSAQRPVDGAMTAEQIVEAKDKVNLLRTNIGKAMRQYETFIDFAKDKEAVVKEIDGKIIFKKLKGRLEKHDLINSANVVATWVLVLLTKLKSSSFTDNVRSYTELLSAQGKSGLHRASEEIDNRISVLKEILIMNESQWQRLKNIHGTNESPVPDNQVDLWLVTRRFDGLNEAQDFIKPMAQAWAQAQLELEVLSKMDDGENSDRRQMIHPDKAMLSIVPQKDVATRDNPLDQGEAGERLNEFFKHNNGDAIGVFAFSKDGKVAFRVSASKINSRKVFHQALAKEIGFSSDSEQIYFPLVSLNFTDGNFQLLPTAVWSSPHYFDSHQMRAFYGFANDFVFTQENSNRASQQLRNFAEDQMKCVALLLAQALQERAGQIKIDMNGLPPGTESKWPTLKDIANNSRQKPDAAMSTEGGINLNPAQMNMQVKKNGEDYSAKGGPADGWKFEFNGQTIDSAQIVGATITIRSIIPVTNLPLLLGLNK